MSLINDALRRAQLTQQPAAPAHLSPSTPASAAQPRRSIGLMAPVTMILVLVLALLLIWQTLRVNSGATISTQPQMPAVSSSEVPRTIAASAAEPSPMVQPQPLPVAVPTPLLSKVANSPAPITNSSTVAPIEPVAPPKPAPLRLQAVIYDPARPSAIVNGHTLFQGDRIGDLKLLSITAESVTLVGARQTNVLTLSQ